MELKEALEKRHCTRKFKEKKCRMQDMMSMMESALKAPCAGGLFSVRLVLVDDEEKKKKLAEAALGQNFIAEASHVLVVCSDGKQTRRMYSKLAEKALRQQAGAAIENIFLRATDLGLGMCWVGAFDDNAVKRILGIPEDVDVEAILPIGYPGEKPSIREKRELTKAVARFNSYPAESKSKTADT